jgi:Cysteine-rich secretory protein family
MVAREGTIDTGEIVAHLVHARYRLAAISLLISLFALGLLAPARSLADDPTFTVQLQNELGVPVDYGVLVADPATDPDSYSEDEPGTVAWSDDDQGDYTWSAPAGSDVSLYVLYPGAVDADCRDTDGIAPLQAIGPITLSDVQPGATLTVAVPTSFPDPGASAAPSAQDQRFAWLVNRLRTSRGVQPVELDPHLDAASAAQSIYQNSRFSASGPGVTQCGRGATTPDFRALEAGYPSGNGQSGEVSADRSTGIDPDDVFAALEANPDDYLVMTDPGVAYVGVGIANGSSDNHLTADFQPEDDGCKAPTSCGGLGFGIEGTAGSNGAAPTGPSSSVATFSGSAAHWTHSTMPCPKRVRDCKAHARRASLSARVHIQLHIAGVAGAGKSVRVYRIDQAGKAHLLASVWTDANGRIAFTRTAELATTGSAQHRAASMNARWASVELRYAGSSSILAATSKLALHVSA